MNQTLQTLPQITEEEWAKTPESVKQVLAYLTKEVEKLKQRVESLEQENRYLREQLKGNSSNTFAQTYCNWSIAAQKTEKIYEDLLHEDTLSKIKQQ